MSHEIRTPINGVIGMLLSSRQCGATSLCRGANLRGVLLRKPPASKVKRPKRRLQGKTDRPQSTLELQITAPDRLPEARGADKAGVYATGAVIDDVLLLLHRP